MLNNLAPGTSEEKSKEKWARHQSEFHIFRRRGEKREKKKKEKERVKKKKYCVTLSSTKGNKRANAPLG